MRLRRSGGGRYPEGDEEPRTDVFAASEAASIAAVPGIGEVHSGDDLAMLLADALDAAELRPCAGDVLVVAQKIVSKAEGRHIDLRDVAPSQRARELAAITGKDVRLVELILGESCEVVRAVRGVLIVRHRRGWVMANAGIDRSNVPSIEGQERVLLLPEDPDHSASVIREAFRRRYGVNLSIVIADSFGRPWRYGVTSVALGCAGMPSLVDRRGEVDRCARKLEVTEVAYADCIASAAALLMGEGAEGFPAVLLRGLRWSAPARPASALVRPVDEDLFR